MGCGHDDKAVDQYGKLARKMTEVREEHSAKIMIIANILFKKHPRSYTWKRSSEILRNLIECLHQ